MTSLSISGLSLWASPAEQHTASEAVQAMTHQLTSSMYSPLMRPSRREKIPPFLASSFTVLLVKAATNWGSEEEEGEEIVCGMQEVV